MAEGARPDEQVVFLTYGKKYAQPTAHRLSRIEVIFIRTFISSGNKTVSAKEAGISTDAASNLLARPEIAQYIEEQLLQQAASAGVTREKVLFAVNHLLENPNVEVSPAHLKAIDIAAKILKMVQPNLHIHQNGPSDSPFKEMNDQQFMEEFQKRVSYRNDNPQLSLDDNHKPVKQEPTHNA